MVWNNGLVHGSSSECKLQTLCRSVGNGDHICNRSIAPCYKASQAQPVPSHQFIYHSKMSTFFGGKWGDCKTGGWSQFFFLNMAPFFQNSFSFSVTNLPSLISTKSHIHSPCASMCMSVNRTAIELFTWNMDTTWKHFNFIQSSFQKKWSGRPYRLTTITQVKSLTKVKVKTIWLVQSLDK